MWLRVCVCVCGETSLLFTQPASEPNQSISHDNYSLFSSAPAADATRLPRPDLPLAQLFIFPPPNADSCKGSVLSPQRTTSPPTGPVKRICGKGSRNRVCLHEQGRVKKGGFHSDELSGTGLCTAARRRMVRRQQILGFIFTGRGSSSPLFFFSQTVPASLPPRRATPSAAFVCTRVCLWVHVSGRSSVDMNLHLKHFLL